MRATELRRYPVKSLGGESLEHSGVGELGLDGNGGVVIALPDGRETADDHELSQWLGIDVALRAADDEGGSFEVPLDFENESNWVCSVRSTGTATGASPSER